MNPQTYSRRRCGQWLGCMTLLAFAGCATRPAHVARSPNASRTGGEIAVFALSLLDMPYVSGGRGAATGFDCSGLVSHVYLQAAGIALRGSAASMAKAARPINPADLMPGDLVFFNTLGYSFSHVGIYVGDGRFVHASNPRTGVRTDRLDSKYYAARFEGAKTVLG
ncbi:cell wall-associated NlpC family hydrolase [Polaromonas sp. CG_9.5]|uniref:C40 family peptidase n=1 Tax=Polaromonas sp. CG_9.5 TaxID=3071705 RepID=UPI002E05F9E0|nr:cell wall-associated NlpC family hydrolase [Polaromonas sp. CG_9.5]